MDQFTTDHLTAWIVDTVFEDDRASVHAAILDFVREHPVVVERGDTWPEIRMLAERRV